MLTNIIAVDFDGTIVDNRWPGIGEPKENSWESLKEIKKNFKLILWTCRTGQRLKECVDFCKDHGIEFDAINENIENLPFDTGRKIFAFHYIDDRAGFKDWKSEMEKINKIKLEVLR